MWIGLFAKTSLQQESQSWDCQPAQKMGQKLSYWGPLQAGQENQNIVQGEIFEGSLIADRCIQFYEHICYINLSKFGPRLQQKIMQKKDKQGWFNESASLSHPVQLSFANHDETKNYVQDK